MAPVPYVQPPGNGLAIASMVLGLAGTVTCMGPLTGVPAIICGTLALRKKQSFPLALVGLVAGLLSICSFLFGVLLALPLLMGHAP